MYADQNPAGDSWIKVRLDEDSCRMVHALAQRSGQEPNVLVKELLIAGIERLLNSVQAAKKDADQA